MEITKWYCCPICGERHNVMEKAVECEKWHHIPERIESAIYQRGRSYPTEIVINMEDGETAIYQFLQG